MIGAADHALERQPVRFASLDQGVHDQRSAVRGRIGVDEFQIWHGRRGDPRLRRKPARSSSSTASRLASSMSRTSTSIRTRLGMLLTAPGKTSQTPTVPRCRSSRWIVRSLSTAKAISAAARNASCRSGISTAPACPPSPSIDDRQAGRRGDRRNHAQRDVVPLQQRSLLDVHFDEGRIVSRRQAAPMPTGPRSRPPSGHYRASLHRDPYARPR